MGFILRWRPNVTILLLAVLSVLKCLYKIRQSSSYHPATICMSVLCPISSLHRTAVIYQVASIRPFKAFTAASTIVMLCGLTKLLIPCRNFSFIMIAVLSIHYAVCQPLQVTPCQVVHPQGVIKLPLEQPSNIELLHIPWGRVPWFWFLAWGWTIQLTSCVAGIWSNASDAPTLSRNAPCTVTMSNCILNACKSHHKQMFQLM